MGYSNSNVVETTRRRMMKCLLLDCGKIPRRREKRLKQCSRRIIKIRVRARVNCYVIIIRFVITVAVVGARSYLVSRVLFVARFLDHIVSYESGVCEDAV